MSETNFNFYCTFHPKQETQLRCNRCERPICIKCATHTPTGYRCPECIRSQQKVFVTTKWFDQVIAVLITGVVSFLGSLLTVYLGFYTIFVAMGAGLLSVWAVKKAINNRRSPLLKIVMSATALIASLPPLITWLVAALRDFRLYGSSLAGGLFTIIWYVVYSVIIASNVYYQLRN